MAWRALAALAMVLLGARPLFQILWVRGIGAPTRVEWTADGRWLIRLAGRSPMEHTTTEAALLNESAILGPCVFLIWSQNGSRRYALIDSAATDPIIFRALRSRLRLEGNRVPRRSKRCT